METNKEKMLVSTNIMDVRATYVGWIGHHIPQLMSDELRLTIVSDIPVLIDSTTGVIYDTARSMNISVVNYILRKASEQIEVAIPPFEIVGSGLFNSYVDEYLFGKWHEDNNGGEFTRETKFFD